MSFNSGYDRDLWAILNDDFPGTDEALSIIETTYLDETLGEIQNWGDVALGVANQDHENAKSIVERSLGSTTRQTEEYCCYGMIHDASIRLTGDMGQILQKLDLTQSVMEFELIKRPQDNPLLEFADGTVLAQVSTEIWDALEAISQKLCQQELIETRAFVRPTAVRDVIQRTRRKFDATLKVDMNVYGSRSNADAVGCVLSECKIFLQDPDHGVVGVDYHNPHLIEFPGFEETTACLAAAERLRKDQKTVENGEAGIVEAGDSRRAQKALHFMKQREEGPIPADYSLWQHIVNAPRRELLEYSHKLTSKQQDEPPEELGGGILADDMGMGKSLTSLALVADTLDIALEWRKDGDKTWGMQTSKRVRTAQRSKATLIIVPSTLIMKETWENDINRHMSEGITVAKYYGKERDAVDPEIYLNSDIIFTTYHTIATSANKPRCAIRTIEWFRIILDEAHMIRRRETTLFQAVSQLSARSRWCLTGTPIQNKLEDLGSLLSFLQVDQLQNKAVFKKYVIGKLSEDFEKGTKAFAELMDSICLRRTRVILGMPEPVESTNWITLSRAEREQYDRTVRETAEMIRQKTWERTGKGNHFGLFQAQLQLRLICNHGTYQVPLKLSRRDRRSEREAMLQTIGLGGDTICSGCGAPFSAFEALSSTLCRHKFCGECMEDNNTSCPVCHARTRVVDEFNDGPNAGVGLPMYADVGTGGYFNMNGISSKMEALMKDVKAVSQLGGAKR
ncbi:uncharacterized protein PgNI_01011 [Pyricularia grisea]|uniref:Helicase ATP-binding domain-containing protein n=1 Tax=Pyricularia grisea TaxID=148305 RepID=A0A6P8BLG4_PYRGI|nr:uncharacterized protein PgNI_01011 [Pyricularia grisea]TLD17495.1 hypothetical protein PgNI_01011 [Pyricularia grisea]